MTRINNITNLNFYSVYIPIQFELIKKSHKSNITFYIKYLIEVEKKMCYGIIIKI